MNVKLSMFRINKTEKRESPQEVYPTWENSSLGLIEAVHQFL